MYNTHMHLLRHDRSRSLYCSPNEEVLFLGVGLYTATRDVPKARTDTAFMTAIQHLLCSTSFRFQDRTIAPHFSTALRILPNTADERRASALWRVDGALIKMS